MSDLEVKKIVGGYFDGGYTCQNSTEACNTKSFGNPCDGGGKDCFHGHCVWGNGSGSSLVCQP